MKVLRTQQPTEAHRAFRDDIVAVMQKHRDLKSVEMLALVSHLIGNLMAMQDASKVDGAMAMQIVMRNIHQGHSDAVNQLLYRTEGHG